MSVRPFCASSPEAAELSDGEFWEAVFHPEAEYLATYEPEAPEAGDDYGRPCEVCGATGECGNDAEGRPMIHVEPEGP